MYMRIIWGRVLPGKWAEFEATFHSNTAKRGPVKGMRGHWLAHDQGDADAGYSISLWDSEAEMKAYWESPQRKQNMAALEPFYVNQYTVTHCSVASLTRA